MSDTDKLRDSLLMAAARTEGSDSELYLKAGDHIAELEEQRDEARKLASEWSNECGTEVQRLKAELHKAKAAYTAEQEFRRSVQHELQQTTEELHAHARNEEQFLAELEQAQDREAAKDAALRAEEEALRRVHFGEPFVSAAHMADRLNEIRALTTPPATAEASDSTENNNG